MALQISEYFETNKLFNEAQHGFRRGRSVGTGLLRLVDIILDGFENSKYTRSIFCDLSKAFDCVPHDTLIRKMKRYGFGVSSIGILEDYLSGRFQSVLSGETLSGPRAINVGVPQGSILGPLLFLIYINDLPKINDNISWLLYADDTTMLIQADNKEALVRESLAALSDAEGWFASNGLSLNREKTEKITFTLRDTDGLEEGPPDVRFLGVRLDPSLAWKCHIDTLCKRLSSTVFMLRSLSDEVSSGALRAAYFSMFQSAMSYGIMLWGHAADWHRVFRLQRKAIRVLSGLGGREECRMAFQDLGILTFPSLYMFEGLKFVRLNESRFPTNKQIHSIDTRFGQDISVPYFRLKKSQNGPNLLFVRYYNALPLLIRSLPYDRFVITIKKVMLSAAFYSCQEICQYDFGRQSWSVGI